MQTLTTAPQTPVVSSPRGRHAAPPRKYIGDGHDLILQGFHWASHAGTCDRGGRRSWYCILQDNAPAIRAAGFTWVWFPPASDSLAPQGYIPRRWNVLHSAYGSEEELRAAIRALRPVRALGDLVLNHRVGAATPGADFQDPPFPDNRAAVVRDDASGVGTGCHDSGEHHPCGRDLDHTNADVRATIRDYLLRLRQVGFQGWRYDLCKGYDGRFIGEYNDASDPEFSVGEFFDADRQKVTNWLDRTGGKTTAFDFPTRYLLHEATCTDDYARLRSTNGGRVVPGGLLGYWPSRAATFVDNHDTEYRRDDEHRSQHNDTRHFAGPTVDMAYAYILTHPGIPCVFWSHYFDWGPVTRQRLDTLIRVRRANGVWARSGVEIREARKGLYAAVIDGRVAVKLGACDWHPGWAWRLAVDGERFAVWTRTP